MSRGQYQLDKRYDRKQLCQRDRLVELLPPHKLIDAPKGLYVADTPSIPGCLALFTKHALPKGTIVGVYQGEEKRALVKNLSPLAMSYVYKLEQNDSEDSDELCVLAHEKRGSMAYMNSRPNTSLYGDNGTNVVMSMVTSLKMLVAVTTRKIMAGEELLLNYGSDYHYPDIKKWISPYLSLPEQCGQTIEDQEPVALSERAQKILGVNQLVSVKYKNREHRDHYNIPLDEYDTEGQKVSIKNSSGTTRLMVDCLMCSERELLLVLSAALEHGADINVAQVNTGRTALYFLLRNKKVGQKIKCAAVKMMIEHGLDLTSIDQEQQSCVDYCVHYGLFDVLATLFQSLPSLSNFNSEKMTALNLLRRNRRELERKIEDGDGALETKKAVVKASVEQEVVEYAFENKKTLVACVHNFLRSYVGPTADWPESIRDNYKDMERDAAIAVYQFSLFLMKTFKVKIDKNVLATGKRTFASMFDITDPNMIQEKQAHLEQVSLASGQAICNKALWMTTRDDVKVTQGVVGSRELVESDLDFKAYLSPFAARNVKSESEKKSYAVYASKKIKKGECLGGVIKSDEYRNMAAFIKHSESPNVEINAEGELVSIKNIKPDEQLCRCYTGAELKALMGSYVNVNPSTGPICSAGGEHDAECKGCNSVEDLEETALYKACYSANVEEVERLLKQGDDPNTPCLYTGAMPLDGLLNNLTTLVNEPSILTKVEAIIVLLKKHGADFHTQTQHGNHVLQSCVTHYLKAKRLGNNVVQRLLKKTISFLMQTESTSDDAGIVDLVTSVTLTNNEGDVISVDLSAHYYALAFGDMDLCWYIMRSYANVNKLFDRGEDFLQQRSELIALQEYGVSKNDVKNLQKKIVSSIYNRKQRAAFIEKMKSTSQLTTSFEHGEDSDLEFEPSPVTPYGLPVFSDTESVMGLSDEPVERILSVPVADSVDGSSCGDVEMGSPVSHSDTASASASASASDSASAAAAAAVFALVQSALYEQLARTSNKRSRKVLAEPINGELSTDCSVSPSSEKRLRSKARSSAVISRNEKIWFSLEKSRKGTTVRGKIRKSITLNKKRATLTVMVAMMWNALGYNEIYGKAHIPEDEEAIKSSVFVRFGNLAYLALSWIIVDCGSSKCEFRTVKDEFLRLDKKASKTWLQELNRDSHDESMMFAYLVRFLQLYAQIKIKDFERGNTPVRKVLLDSRANKIGLFVKSSQNSPVSWASVVEIKNAISDARYNELSPGI